MRSRSDQNIEAWALLVFYTMLVITMAIEVLRREIFAYSSIWERRNCPLQLYLSRLNWAINCP